MDTAYCTLDGHTYHVTSFSQLSASDMQAKRRHLICPECRWQAYFKRAATSGQGACFGARPHSPNCGLTAPVSLRGPGSDETQDILHNSMDHIVIDLNYGAHETIHGDPEDVDNTRGRGGRFTGEGHRGPARMNRRLRPLLKSLISSEQFRNSSMIIELTQHTTLPVNQFFVNFSDISDQHEGTFRGYWGLVFDTGMSNDGAFWLNTGKYSDLSVLITSDLYSDFRQRAGFQQESELEGMHVLVLGKLRRATTGKLIVDVDSVDLCTLCDD